MERYTNIERFIILHNIDVIRNTYNSRPDLVEKQHKLMDYIFKGGKCILLNEETNLYERASEEEMIKAIRR